MVIAQKKAALLEQAEKLYTLGLEVEMCRQKLRRLAEHKIPYDSLQMQKALAEYQAADEEWKRLEREHLQIRAQLGVNNHTF